MKLDELGNLRRTHLSTEVTAQLAGKEIVAMGRVGDVRDLGGIKFFILSDISGSIQVTAPKAKVGKKLLAKIDGLTQESAVAVRGKVVATKQAPRGVEIFPSEIRVLNLASVPLPLDPRGRVKANLDTRLDARALDLRRPESLAIFKIRHQVLQSARNHLVSRGFIEVNTPKIVATATESGAALFPISYFEREAFLSQSPQLYKEVLTGCFDRVFEIGPIFRAEEHDTPRHLNEAISIDIEVAYAAAEDVMKILEDLIVEVFSDVKRKCAEELKTLNHKLEVPKKPLQRVTYDEALEKLERGGVKVPWGEDLPTPAGKKLGELIGGAYFVVDWPLKIKPFYTMPKEDNPKLAQAFDLMHKGIELASGGTRVHQEALLVKQLKQKGLNPRNFESHLQSHRAGLPPHAGWGLGLDRLTMALTAIENIRECVLFPRDRKRLTP
ncbi:MAG: aspartate--tRNA(Asn) ligase [Hadesarchaea archaeon B3_Hades]|nr:MAG: aspartate--tRNA(Asn) ligase [Hadesarchaea archaeon B3_Hades]